MRFRDLAIGGLFGLCGLLAFGPVEAQTLSPGDVFVDCEDVCPQMVVIPAGRHGYGPRGDSGVTPVATATVTFARPFAIGRFELTFDEWDACVAAGGCRGVAFVPATSPEHVACRREKFCSSHQRAIAGTLAFDEGWGRGRRPVINVNQADVALYLDWLSQRTGRTYRLPSAAEWTYASGGLEPIAGPVSSWADHANVDNSLGRTLPVGAYEPNQFGAYDMVGNVGEMVAGCGSGSQVPTDGTASVSGDCTDYLIALGTWRDNSTIVHHWGNRAHRTNQGRGWGLGFRVARDL